MYSQCSYTVLERRTFRSVSTAESRSTLEECAAWEEDRAASSRVRSRFVSPVCLSAVETLESGVPSSPFARKSCLSRRKRPNGCAKVSRQPRDGSGTKSQEQKEGLFSLWLCWDVLKTIPRWTEKRERGLCLQSGKVRALPDITRERRSCQKKIGSFQLSWGVRHLSHRCPGTRERSGSYSLPAFQAPPPGARRALRNLMDTPFLGFHIILACPYRSRYP